jgi:hypothetical protein
METDPARAWQWYRRGAEAGEPHALARFAERDQLSVATEDSPKKRNVLLLHAFALYAIASERARVESWPNAVSQVWRYRRASLARMLAHEGRTSDVAAQYLTAISVVKGAPVPVEIMENPT